MRLLFPHIGCQFQVPLSPVLPTNQLSAEVPMTPACGSINLLEQLTDLKRNILLTGSPAYHKRGELRNSQMKMRRTRYGEGLRGFPARCDSPHTSSSPTHSSGVFKEASLQKSDR